MKEMTGTKRSSHHCDGRACHQAGFAGRRQTIEPVCSATRATSDSDLVWALLPLMKVNVPLLPPPKSQAPADG